jgi:hypothetical protein
MRRDAQAKCAIAFQDAPHRSRTKSAIQLLFFQFVREELGDRELKVKLEEIASDEGRHARELRRLLKGL